MTRGDVDLTPIVESLPFDDIVIYDNSHEPDLKVYGRYAAIERARRDVIYVQDDDCLTDPRAVADAYDPETVVCNMPQEYRPGYRDGIALVGFGAVFHRRLVDFSWYLGHYPMNDLFMRECDRIFTYGNKLQFVDVPVRHLPHSTAPNRMWKESRHGDDVKEIRRRLYSLRHLDYTKWANS